MRKKATDKIVLELFNVMLVAVIGWATWYIVIFKERTIPVIISFVLLGGSGLFCLWKSLWYNFKEKHVLPIPVILMLSGVFSFIVTMNIIEGTTLLKAELQLIALYFGFLILIPIYLIMLFWKWYNGRLAVQKEGVVDRGFRIIRLLAIAGLVPTLIVCSLITIFLLGHLIFY